MYFLKGLLKMILIIISLPTILILFIIFMVEDMGGKKIEDSLLYKFFKLTDKVGGTL